MNWGWKVACLLGAFVIFIVSMVVQSFNHSIDLVSEDYYQRELNYQTRIDAIERSKTYQKAITVEVNNHTVDIDLTSLSAYYPLVGTVQFYRPEDASKDKKMSLKPINGVQKIPKSMLTKGNYEVFIDFVANGKAYHINKTVHI